MISFSVLIVEDSCDLRELLAMALQDRGYLVRCACDGCEAMELLEREDFGIVLTDLCMPRMDGVELIREVRARDRSPPLPIIVMSAACDGPSEALSAANAVLSKPFDLEPLFQTLQDLGCSPPSN